MQLIHIYHSCFAAVDEGCLVVYDYWQDPKGTLHALLENALQSDIEVFFVVSHFHTDHFNPEITGWCMEHKRWHLIPSYDTIRRRRIPRELPLAELRPGTRVETPYFTLKAYHSTDVGVSTVTEMKDGTVLYHAGDNNNWYFPSDELPASSRVKVTAEQMDKLYASTLREIKHDYPVIDHAMIPVDHRLGQEMMRGPLQFIQAIEVHHFHPMHYADLSALLAE